MSSVKQTVNAMAEATVQGSSPDLAFKLTEINMKFKKGLMKDLLPFGLKKHCGSWKNDTCPILFLNMGPPEDWKLLVFTDAAHANLCD